MALTFDTHEAIRRLREKGHGEDQAEGVVEFVRDATAELVTTAHLDSRLEVLEARLDARLEASEGRLRGDLYRALWIQGAGIVTINAAIIAAAVTLAQAFD